MAEDLPLPGGQIGEGQGRAALFPAALDDPRQDAGQFLGHHRVPGEDVPEGGDKLVRLHVLEQIALGPGLEGGDQVTLVGAGGEHGDGHGLPGLAQPLEDLQPRHLGHAQVEEDHIRPGLHDPGDARLAVALGIHGDAPTFQKLAQPEAEQGMIIDQQHVHQLTSGGREDWRSGSEKCSSTRVPSSGSDSMRSSAPMRRARSRMMERPICSPS